MLYPTPALAKVLLEKPELLKEVWQALDHISDEALMGEGRVYGSGLDISQKEIACLPLLNYN
jgi:hypothetical protein